MSELDRPLNSLGDEQLTVSNVAVGLTLPAGARRAVIQVKTAAIYFTEDGGTPASNNGLTAVAEDVLEYLGADYRTVLTNFKAIRQSADASLNVLYYD